eukprot:CAMPEP_0174948964 /NCGR_PEP_ID=MMETSP1355-20121228/90377_1 /TAXON_ID=464990 /ORGANISM="Hemiselmis tepida, Strain CCMP443" /LENGTH=61 /DNA_ID=CAMNT_0016196507 /DNA_START=607 /DNA_END=792 /DNA_ORIENTATION=-
MEPEAFDRVFLGCVLKGPVHAALGRRQLLREGLLQLVQLATMNSFAQGPAEALHQVGAHGH